MAPKIEVQICLGSSCFSRGNKDLVSYIKDYIRANKIEDKIIFRGARCMGKCIDGPNLVINGVEIEGVTPGKIESILEKEFGKLIK